MRSFFGLSEYLFGFCSFLLILNTKRERINFDTPSFKTLPFLDCLSICMILAEVSPFVE